jgi:hypothetical protein
MRVPAKRELDDWIILALLLGTAGYLVFAESFWTLFPF